ncbi:Bcr/CflA family drug resistance efflux transporter [Jannaschia pagri]|uniref:Bcr/CflA family efflux transporter n=1 Tax=Jannaschia pagri TaxID=2829797 RepID=A0ABQ4NJK3_9RHOB|nr:MULTISPECIES: multidrug effflux MFS transporter [unclassified Jannaschia]GIT90547.1 Bcr/CflA family drug resistance efflux transporter [Jannaschia sp. AI_61]GIT94379.1 Bcr/CflA family drug resistance efflux transporter [Jannaschia sp. AI_62]
MSNSIAQARPGRTPPHILTLVALVGVSTLSMNVFLPSLPAMAEFFAADYGLIQLSVGLYLGVNAVLQLIVGPLSDRYGRRPVILWGLVIFMAATVGCIFAPTVEVFLVFRMIQAAVVVAMVLSRAVVRDLYPQDKAASMLGYVTMGMSVVPMIGPAIGGWLESQYGWQSNFWLLLGAGVFLVTLTWIDLGETAPKAGGSFRDQVRDYPELLTSPRFWGYCAASAFASGAFFAYLGGAPYVGTEIYGLDPATLGLYFGAPAVGYFAGNFISGRFSQRVGIDRMILVGTLGQVVGLSTLVLLTLSGWTNDITFFAFMTFVGLGNGMVIPNATAGMLSVRPHLAGTASGLGGAMMIGGGAALSAVAGWVLQGAATPLPLEVLMVSSGVASVVAITLTIRRNRRLAAA